MTQDTFRFAYEEANAELREILERFEQLRLRMVQMESVVQALRPLVSDEPMAEAGAESEPGETAPFLVQQTTEMIPVPMPETVIEPAAEPGYADAGDPFQRRVDNALRHGLGARDARVLSLGLNGLLTRA